MKRKPECVPFESWETYAKFLLRERNTETSIKESYLSYIIHKGLYSDYMDYVGKRRRAAESSVKRMRSVLRGLLRNIQEFNGHV